MKAKTIRSILTKKFDNFTASIKDEGVRELVRKNTIITGGCIVSMLLKQNVNDYDMYFRDEYTALAVAKYYIGEFKKNPPPVFKNSHPVNIGVVLKDGRVKIVVKSAGIAGENPATDYQYFETIGDPTKQQEAVDDYVRNVTDLDDESADKLVDDPEDKGEKYRPVFLSSNAITLANRVQLIIRFTGEPDKIHENYDFVHCTSYWCSWDCSLVLRQGALESIIAKELRYVGSRYPICSMIRTRKFIAAGWTINAGQFVKMAWQISKLNLADVEVLEDQLVGVDAAYFNQVISILQKSPNPKEIDGNYLMTIIDKLF